MSLELVPPAHGPVQSSDILEVLQILVICPFLRNLLGASLLHVLQEAGDAFRPASLHPENGERVSQALIFHSTRSDVVTVVTDHRIYLIGG
jgi:hypothetical protein